MTEGAVDSTDPRSRSHPLQLSPQTPRAGGTEETPPEPLPQHRDPAILALTHLPPHARARRRREATAGLTGFQAACVTAPVIAGRMAQGPQEHQEKVHDGNTATQLGDLYPGGLPEVART